MAHILAHNSADTLKVADNCTSTGTHKVADSPAYDKADPGADGRAGPATDALADDHVPPHACGLHPADGVADVVADDGSDASADIAADDGGADAVADHEADAGADADADPRAVARADARAERPHRVDLHCGAVNWAARQWDLRRVDQRGRSKHQLAWSRSH